MAAPPVSGVPTALAPLLAYRRLCTLAAALTGSTMPGPCCCCLAAPGFHYVALLQGYITCYVQQLGPCLFSSPYISIYLTFMKTTKYGCMWTAGWPPSHTRMCLGQLSLGLSLFSQPSISSPLACATCRPAGPLAAVRPFGHPQL